MLENKIFETQKITMKKLEYGLNKRLSRKNIFKDYAALFRRWDLERNAHDGSVVVEVRVPGHGIH